MVRRYYRWDHSPRIGDLFNDRSRGPWRSNGFIKHIFWKNAPKEVMVMFWTKGTAMEAETYEFDEIEGKWTDRYGGTWLMEEHPNDRDAAIRIQAILKAVFGLT